MKELRDAPLHTHRNIQEQPDLNVKQNLAQPLGVDCAQIARAMHQVVFLSCFCLVTSSTQIIEKEAQEGSPMLHWIHKKPVS